MIFQCLFNISSGFFATGVVQFFNHMDDQTLRGSH